MSQPEIHDKIRAEVGRRLAVARAAEVGTPSPWGGNDEVIYDAESSSILVGPWGSLDDQLLAYLLLHDPADAIRRYEYALKVLRRHLNTSSACDLCSNDQWVARHPCPEVADLATSVGIEVSQ